MTFSDVQCQNSDVNVDQKASHQGTPVVPPASRASVQQASLEPSSPTLSFLEAKSFSLFHVIADSTEDAPAAPILAPITLNDVKYLALVDTGADISLVSAEVADALRLPITPRSGEIRMGLATATPSSRMGAIEAVVVGCGKITRLHDFEVAPLWQDTKVILGRDLLPHLGIALTNVPVMYPAEVKRAQEMQRPRVLVDPGQSDADECISDESNQALLENLKVKASIQRNTSIPPNARCSLKEAMVTLNTGDAPPVYTRQYPVPKAFHPHVDNQITNWLGLGVIVPAPDNSPYNSPLLCVAKKDAQGLPTSIRVVIDPQPLNKQLPDDDFPLANIKEIFADMAGASIFSTIDLHSAYHQLPIKPADQVKTTFTWNSRRYHFTSCPFGIKHITSFFQRVMQIVLHDLPFVRVYVDDIVIFSAVAEDHATHLSMVLDRLSSNNLRINLAKCRFGRQKVHLLGHIISVKGIEVDPKKLALIQEWPAPSTGKDLQRFLGLANYLRAGV